MIATSVMTCRERMAAAIAHQPLDRIPTDIWATPEVWRMLQAHFGKDADVCDRLDIDAFAHVGPRYIGPPLPTLAGERVDMWGIRSRTVAYGTGSYEEQTHHPLAAARTIADLEAYAWPQTAWFDFSEILQQAQSRHRQRLIKSGYMAIFYHHNLLRGMERSLLDPFDDPDFTAHLLGRLSDWFIAYHRRLFESAAGLIDIAEVTDDYGSQSGPMISLATFRRWYLPHLKRFIALCREFGIKVFHHDDGAIRPFLPDLIEAGIDILNPVQHTCPGMDMAGLKRDFGAKVCFHGAVENQRILPFGTTDEVRAEVRRCIDTLAGDGTGYILASCHNLQPVTPLANILAMYDEARNYGRIG